jgi:hypothetical protein
MRFLGNFHDPDERTRVRNLLESHGIPVFRQGGLSFGLSRHALFVCLNEQYSDALALLENESHEVRNPVNIEQFEKAERTSGLQLELKYALLVLLGIVLIWAAVVAIAWWQGIPIMLRG